MMRSCLLILGTLGAVFVTPAAAEARQAFLQPEREKFSLSSTGARLDELSALDDVDGAANPTAVAVASAAVSARRAPIGGKEADRVWPQESGLGFWVKAFLVILYISLIMAVAIAALYSEEKRTWTTICQAVALFVWLAGSIFLFCYHLDFQSPHFGADKDGNGIIRRLNLVETIYLLSQIITTVGYGDITPASENGMIVVAMIVMMSILLIASMVSAMVQNIQERIDKAAVRSMKVEAAELKEGNRLADDDAPPLKALLGAITGFAVFVVIGCLFFHFYPGEEKTPFQGIYMSIITLSTVGFGAFTATTEGGKVFAAFWMLFGVGSLGSLVGAFTEYLTRMKAMEGKKSHDLIKELQHKMESNKDTACDFEMFLEHSIVHNGWCSEKKLQAVKAQFAALDKKKKGKFSIDDIKALKLSPKPTDRVPRAK